MVTENEEGVNTRTPWPDEDKVFALQHRGYLSPAQIATAIGVTRKAVYHFFQAQTLNPLETPDGWITISECARRLGLVPATLYERINNGELQVTRVEGSTRSWIKPEELERLSGRWRGDNLIRAELRKAEGKPCINCGSFLLERKGNNTCGSLCRSEQASAQRFKQKNGYDDPFLVLPPHLRLGFQESLEEERFLISWPWVTDQYKFPFKRGYQPTEIEKQIKWVFSCHRGRVITTNYISAILARDAQKYGLWVDVQTQRVPITSAEVALTIQRLEKPENIFTTGSGEWVVAVHSIFSRDQQMAFRFLREHQDRFVKARYLEMDMNMYGGRLEVGSYNVIDGLSTQINGHGWRIEEQQRPVGSNNFFYRLIKT